MNKRGEILPPIIDWHLRSSQEWELAPIGAMGSFEGKLLEQMEDGAVRMQCPHGGNPVTVLPNPGRRDPCPPRLYVHRCMK
eukprot:8648158-Prorocentrum_lima.AAC.1